MVLLGVCLLLTEAGIRVPTASSLEHIEQRGSSKGLSVKIRVSNRVIAVIWILGSAAFFLAAFLNERRAGLVAVGALFLIVALIFSRMR